MCKKTKILDVLGSDKTSNLELGAQALKDGELVVFPTETVYGLGANIFNDESVKNIFIAKGRPQDNPLIVHVAKEEQIFPLIQDFNDKAKIIAKNFWPGPLTMIFQKSDIVSDVVSGGLDTVAVRIPSNPIAHELLLRAGVPVAAPSANRSGSPSPTTAQHTINDLLGRVDYILDGGSSLVGVESTVISMVDEVPMLLRPGGVTVEQLEEVVGEININHGVLSQMAKGEKAVSPGLKYKHYAPKADVVLLHGTSKAFGEYCNNSIKENKCAMGFEEDESYVKIPFVSYGRKSHPEELANHLFAVLRMLDDNKNVDIIYIHAPTSEGIGLAVYNRLLRAASFNEIHL